jgi:TP901 family phage tail tape measure protein
MSDALTLAMRITAVDLGSRAFDLLRQKLTAVSKTSEAVNQNFEQMTKHLRIAGYAASGSAYFAGKMVKGAEAAGQLETALSSVRRAMATSNDKAGELDKTMQRIRLSASETAKSTGKSAVDIVRVQNELLRAGMNESDVTGKRGAAWATTSLAKLEGIDPAETGKTLANIGNMYRLKGSQFGDLADWMSRVSTATSADVQTLSYGMKMSGGSASTLGISAKETASMLGVLAPLQDRAGQAMNEFLMRVTTKTFSKFLQNASKATGKDLRAFDKEGKFLGAENLINVTKESLGAIKDDETRLRVATQLFGDQAGRAAMMFTNADITLSDLNATASNMISLEAQLKIQHDTYEDSMKRLENAMINARARAFDPLVKAFGFLADKGSTALGVLDNPIAGGVTAAATTTGAVALGGLAAWQGYRALKSGLKGVKAAGGWKGMLSGAAGNAGSTALGIAEGKAIEAATGVQPVFVTNWPGTNSFGQPAGPGFGLGRNETMLPMSPTASMPGIPAATKALGKAPWWKFGGSGLAKVAGKSLGKKLLTGAAGVFIPGIGWASTAMLAEELLSAGVGAFSGGKYENYADAITDLVTGGSISGGGPKWAQNLPNNQQPINIKMTLQPDRLITEADSLNVMMSSKLPAGNLLVVGDR